MVPLSYYEEAYDYCQKLDSKFIYSIQTNGTLLNKENIDFFKKHDTSIGLSFDGLSNSKTRGNTQTILNKIELLKSKEMYPGAIIVVNQNNVRSLIEEYEYFKNCYGGCNANAILSEINNNDISCYIQRGILSELKKIIIKLECEKNYDKLNYNFAKILIKKER